MERRKREERKMDEMVVNGVKFLKNFKISLKIIQINIYDKIFSYIQVK